MKQQQSPGRLSVSAFYESAAEVARVLERLTLAGIPRDLVEVVVSPEAAAEFYPRRARRLGNQSFRYAGIGALVGFLGGAGISLFIVMMPGFAPAGWAAIAQLLGPNVGTLLGGVIGALAGLFAKRRARDMYHRALERKAILVLVHDRRTEDLPATQDILAQAGGSQVETG
jgi:MFS family permease